MNPFKVMVFVFMGCILPIGLNANYAYAASDNANMILPLCIEDLICTGGSTFIIDIPILEIKDTDSTYSSICLKSCFKSLSDNNVSEQIIKSIPFELPFP